MAERINSIRELSAELSDQAKFAGKITMKLVIEPWVKSLDRRRSLLLLGELFQIALGSEPGIDIA